MGIPLGPRYIPYTYTDPLGDISLLAIRCEEQAGRGMLQAGNTQE